MGGCFVSHKENESWWKGTDPLYLATIGLSLQTLSQ